MQAVVGVVVIVLILTVITGLGIYAINWVMGPDFLRAIRRWRTWRDRRKGAL